MTQNDFLKIIGAESSEAEFLPVACLLHSGYGLVGYYHATLNEGLDSSCVLVNGRLIEFKSSESGMFGQSIKNFNDFLQQIVRDFQEQKSDPLAPANDAYGSSIPLTAVPYSEIAIIYPVAHISALWSRMKSKKKAPSFLDFEQSVTLKLLKTKLW